MSPDIEGITARIRAARAHANLSQPELAERIGMSLPTYKRAELGKRPVSTPELIRIAAACDVPPHYVITPWSESEPMRRHANPEDVPAQLALINERLDAIESAGRRIFEVLESTVLRRGMPLSATAEDEPSGITR